MEGGVISLNTDPLGKTEDVQIPNPFAEYQTLAEATKAAGFELTVPNAANGSDCCVFQAVKGELLEVIYYHGEDETARVRKAPGDGDISGDCNEYAQVKTADGITMKGENGLVMVAIWEQNGYTYSITVENGISAGAMTALVRTVK